jgi:SAM-dependent methyltransferase
MKPRPWDVFYEEKLKELFAHSRIVIDIGGGLRVRKEKNNRYDPNSEWLRPLIDAVDYKVLDPVPDYHPDIIGDIHELPFPDDSIDAIICKAVLEHVKNPFKAVDEMHRVLKPGGYCFVFVPFLYYYHPMKGYYGDYWRFTSDGMQELFKGFARFEICNVRGAIESLVHLSPLGRYKSINSFGRFLDGLFHKTKTEQTAGFHLLAIK